MRVFSPQEFKTRLKERVYNHFDLTNLAEWITKHTVLDGNHYSFLDHEYQTAILQDDAPIVGVVKIAQVGASELHYRLAMAAVCTQRNFNVIYTFPSTSDATKNCATRIDPMIEASEEASRLVDPNLNNTEVKKFGENSFLFFRGTFSETAGLSIPANMIIHDEVDKSNLSNMSVYNSRLQHRPHKLKRLFSTPTLAGYGISKEAEQAKRYKHINKCNHCNHHFLFDFSKQVKVPGWDRPLKEITSTNLHTTKWKEAYLVCPNCGLEPEVSKDTLEFVLENPSENHDAHFYYLNPLTGHAYMTMPYLVQQSTVYERYSEFRNQALGETAEEESDQLVEKDIRKMLVRANLESTDWHVMGVDLGLVCTIIVMREKDGTLVVPHKEKCSYTELEQRLYDLGREYKVGTAVLDSQPYTDTVTRLCNANEGYWGGVFVNSKNPQAFTLKEYDGEEGAMEMRTVNINRTNALEQLTGVIKRGEVVVQESDLSEGFVTEMVSLKKVAKFTKQGDLHYVYDKTDGKDHFHFALLYAYLATQIATKSIHVSALSKGRLMLRKIKNRL